MVDKENTAKHAPSSRRNGRDFFRPENRARHPPFDKTAQTRYLSVFPL
jgi:hypothetical protein